MALRPDATSTAVFAVTPIEISRLPVGYLWDNRYQIVARLGEGGMSVVYQATDIRLGKPVALKILLPYLADDEKSLARFRIEGTIAARLRNPHIRKVFAFSCPAEYSPYITMEYLTGTTLQQRIREGEPLPVGQALHIAVQLSRALGAAHRKLIYHRDVKPENVMLVRRGTDPNFAILYDFGLLLTEEIGRKIDKPGFAPGTPEYMAPEQARGGLLDGRAEVFSLGIVLYQMLTGQRPFTGNSASEVMINVITVNHRPLRRLRPEISDHVETIVNYMLSKDRDKRPRDMREVEIELTKIARKLRR